MRGGPPTARLVEVFSAIQGEGLNVGHRQIFVRFSRCDLRCRFCDSAHTWGPAASARVERTPGQRDYEQVSNPVGVDDVLGFVAAQHTPRGLHDSVSLTGGEPLLHAKFLKQLLPRIRDELGLRVYLESGGHRPDLLAHVLEDVDSIGMDVKLPSVSGERRWAAHERFLRIAHEKEVFTKVVISRNTDVADLERTVELVAGVDPSIPTYLQPVTPLSKPLPAEGVTSEVVFGADEPPLPEQVLDWQLLLRDRGLKNVWVVPQTHKFIGQE